MAKVVAAEHEPFSPIQFFPVYCHAQQIREVGRQLDVSGPQYREGQREVERQQKEQRQAVVLAAEVTVRQRGRWKWDARGLQHPLQRQGVAVRMLCMLCYRK